MPAKLFQVKYGISYYEVDCLGWCKKKIITDEPSRIRYCPRCRRMKKEIEEGMSKILKNQCDGIILNCAYSLSQRLDN